MDFKMTKNIDQVISHGDEDLLSQFETIDELSESDVRICAKKAYADLKEAHVSYHKRKEETDEIIEVLKRQVHELRAKIRTRDEKIRQLFDL
jgi:hypothetical protein